MGFIFSPPRPPAPPPPPPPPPPPTREDPEVQRQKEKERQALRRRMGRNATILTSGLGVTAETPIERKVLLGQ